jgi:EAL domain-containing protein (putative c-di-GMP-specific phosphodiesterase class I)
MRHGLPGEPGPSADEPEGLVKRLLAPGALRIVGQPIVELRDGIVIGYEALVRFRVHPDLTPDAGLRIARAAGYGTDLELAAVKQALTHLDDLPPGRLLSVNISPETATSEVLEALLGSIDSDRVVLEITEQQEVESYVWLNRALLGLRVAGLQVAIDDVGGGANWRHLIHLQPDIIKLGGSLTRDVEADPVRRSIIKALVGLADELRATLAAEHVESQGQANVLTDLGVAWGQGYLFRRPAPFTELLAGR